MKVKMMLPKSLFILPLCLITPAFGLPLSIASFTNDLPYQIVPMTYSHTIKGRNVELNGTIQEVVWQLQDIDPDFTLNSTLSDQENFGLESRGKYEGNVKCCIPPQSIPGYNWSPCIVGGIKGGIFRLNGIKGTCNIGPRSCTRLSCSYDAGIWLCNDNDYSISPTCSYLGTYATDLLNDCQDVPDQTVCGQEFDSDGYNVIVHYESC